MAIYFIEMDGQSLVKIGFTERDPMDRLRELQTACPFKLRLALVMAGGLNREGELHNTFAHLRTEGEWFRLTPELQTYMSLARFVFPRLVEIEDRLEKCRNALSRMDQQAYQAGEDAVLSSVATDRLRRRIIQGFDSMEKLTEFLDGPLGRE